MRRGPHMFMNTMKTPILVVLLLSVLPAIRAFKKESDAIKRRKLQGSTRSCFNDNVEAAAIASKNLASLWQDSTATQCNEQKIAKLLKNYFTEDAVVTLGGTTFVGVEAISAAVAPILAGYCLDSFLYWEPVAIWNPSPEGRTFVFVANELVNGPSDFCVPIGREFLYVLDRKCRPKISFVNVTDRKGGYAFHWTSTGGGWVAMVANMGLANVFAQHGLLDQGSSKFSSIATNSGSSWFSLQMFYSTEFFQQITGSPETLSNFVVQWMTAYGNLYDQLGEPPVPCLVPAALQGLCPIFQYFGGNWALFVEAMLNATSDAYGSSGLVDIEVNRWNQVEAFTNTTLRIQMSLAPNSRPIYPDVGLYLGPQDSEGTSNVFTVPISTQYFVQTTGTGYTFAVPEGIELYTSRAPVNFTFEEFAGYTLFPGRNGSLRNHLPEYADDIGPLPAPFRSAPDTIGVLAGFTSAAAGVFSGKVPSMLSQVFSIQRFQILSNPNLNEAQKAFAIGQLTAGANLFYQTPLFNGLAVCGQFPDECSSTDGIYFVDGIYTDNPSLALNVGGYQNSEGGDRSKTLKVVIANADPGSIPIYNAALFLSYFSTTFNQGVEPGGYIWAPGHATPWRSQQIFGDSLNFETLVSLAVPIERTNISTTLLSGTTIDNAAFGVHEGQRVELLLVNFNYSIPTDIITPEAIETYTLPLAKMALDIATSEVLAERVKRFFMLSDL